VTWADEIVRARLAKPEEIELLEMQDMDPAHQFVYERNRISYDQTNRPLEVLLSVDRLDLVSGYQYRVVEDEPHFSHTNSDND
jgi:DNA-binding GntR family transcriptional regulator